MRGGPPAPTTIDGYIASFPTDIQAILQRIRTTIRMAAPEAQEAIRYQMPTFVLQGNLVHFAAFKNHIGVYPTPSATERFRKELSVYQGGKGSVRFPLDKPIPYDLINRIVEFRVKENLEKAAAKAANHGRRTSAPRTTSARPSSKSQRAEHTVSLDQFFAEHERSRPIFNAVARTVAAAGPAQVRVTKSQIAFRRRTGFAFVWLPETYLGRRGAPLVLTIGLRRRDDSPRWKQIVEPSPGRFTHHLELRSPSDVDQAVAGWLREAWEAAA